jgi:hypothetical protein
MKDVKIGCKALSILMLITLLVNFSNVYVPLKIVYYLHAFNGFAFVLVVMGLLFFIINSLAIVGIFRRRWWGFATGYTAIVFSTIIFSTSYIPFFNYLFPVRYVSLALLIANVAVLIVMIYLHVMVKSHPPRVKKVAVKKPVVKKTATKKIARRH